MIFEHPLLKNMAKNWKKIVQSKSDESQESSSPTTGIVSQNDGSRNTEVVNSSAEDSLETPEVTEMVFKDNLPPNLSIENDVLTKLFKEREILEKEFEALVNPEAQQEKVENTRFNNPIESIFQKKKSRETSL